jgi:hypothetical protein
VTAIAFEERRAALAVACGLTATTLAVAAIVRVGWAAEARRMLGFGFTGVPARLDTAVSIFAGNALLLAAIFGAILVAQSPWLAGREAHKGPVMNVLTAAVDAVLALAVAVNVALVGGALGAYGERMAVAMLPHGPLELAAYALALALYLRSRRGPLPTRHVLAVGAVCLAGLALAALLETFAVP